MVGLFIQIKTMRTIIVGADFSASSLNACHYAAYLAQKLDCKLTLFNLFDAPIIHSNVGLYGFSYSSIRKHGLEKTTKLIRQLNRHFPHLIVEAFNTSGNFKDELQYFTQKHHVVAAVMGLESKEKLSKYIFGSHGVSIAGKVDCPVIIVPSSYKKHHLSKILLAVDNNEKLLKSPLKRFENFVSGTKSKLDIVHVRTPQEIFAPKKNVLKFNGKNVAINTLESKNLEDGVKKKCALTGSNMIAVVSKRHSVFYDFFSETNTKKIAFAVKVPVMALHE